MTRSSKKAGVLNVLLVWIHLISVGSVFGLEMHFEQKEGGFFLRSPSPMSSLSTSPSSSSSAEYEQFGRSSIDNSNWDFDINNGGIDSSSTSSADASLVTSEHFTVFPSSQPVSIRATYGPFSTKQTVPVRLLVPDPLDNVGSSSSSTNNNNNTYSAEAEMIPPLDLSAHLVTPTIPKDTPILRVLFHAGQTAFGLPMPPQSNPRGYRQQNLNGSPSSTSRRHRTRLCLVAQVSKSLGDVITASCSPDARDSTCLTELTLPIHWWPEAPLITNENNNANNANGPVKPIKIPVQVSYWVYEPENGHCNEIGLSTRYDFGIVGEGSGTKRIQIQPPTPLATALLIDAQKSYRIVKADQSDSVKLLVPQGPLYPHAKFYVPVIVGKHDHQSIVAFIMRARVKSGVRIIGIEPNIDKMWNITTDFNPRRTHATITAVRKFDPRFQEAKSEGEEVFNWILEAAEEPNDDWDGGRVVWILRYVIQPSTDTSWMKQDPFSNFDDERHRLTTRLEIQKDDIQAVIPIAKSWEIVNTAVLDGKQVSRPMKIFIVNRSGQVADVTLQASCRSLDESVLKVSSSCTSVYVDGSEIRGSTNATITIKYGTYEGQAEFIVWMPEFPLDIQLSDPKLNQIKGWRVPNGLRPEKEFGIQNDGYDDKMGWKRMEDAEALQEQEGSEPTIGQETAFVLSSSSSSVGPNEIDDIDRQQPQPLWSEHDESEDHEQTEETESDDFDVEDKFQCKLRYQHSRIDVYAKFLASDHDSGRTSYFITKKTYLKVTDLISDYLRVSDAQVAVIKGNSIAIQGVGPGRTEVQVVSPVTGRVLGAQEIRVVNEKVSITSMKVQVISGVQLSLYPDSDSDNEFVAETIITSKLSAKYQEALLDIKLTFSDNTWITLDEVDRTNYVLAVDSLEPRVVELPPIQNSKYPRILAVSEGGGPIMRVSLELSDQCHRQNSQPLAMSVAQVEVNFTTTSTRSEFTQNDSQQGTGLSKHSFRKPSRTKEQRFLTSNGSSMKKDLSSSLTSGNTVTVNDITGIPLKDDSNRASRPSTHMEAVPIGGFAQNKGWTFSPHSTPLEVAMYVLLGVFSVAILVFVASCVVYASRVKKRELSHQDGLSGFGFKFDPTSRSGGAGNAQNDWIWLGRASLALHPTLDAGAKHYNSQSKQSVSFDSKNGINPIRIITNPNFDPSRSITGGNSPNRLSNGELAPQLQQNILLSSGAGFLNMNTPLVAAPSPMIMLPQSSSPFSKPEPPNIAPPPRPPKPQANHKTPSPVPLDSTTFSKISPNGKGQSLPGGNEYRPPVPPHRNLTSSAPMSPQTSPPRSTNNTPPRSSKRSTKPVHHHRIKVNKVNRSHNRKAGSSGSGGSLNCDDPDELPNPSYVDYESNKKNRRGLIIENEKKQNSSNNCVTPNVVGNPMCYIDEEEESYDDDDNDLRLTEPLTVAAGAAARQNHKVKIQNNDSVKLNMDYDQLMEYFDSLKETEA